MTTFLVIAWRNVWRNRRRTLLTASAIAFSLTATIYVVALNDGQHWNMIRVALERSTGAVQVQRAPEPELRVEEVVDWQGFAGALGRLASPGGALQGLALPPTAAGAVEPSFEEKVAVLRSLDPVLGSPALAGPPQADETPESRPRRRRGRLALDALVGPSLAPLADKSYQRDPTVEKTFPVDEALLAAVAGTPRVLAVAPRVQVGALVASGSNSSGGLVVGISPDAERQVSALARMVRDGEFLLPTDERMCLVGCELAKLLSVGLGDTVVAVTQGVDGSTGALRLRVKGILATGSTELDRAQVVALLADVQGLIRAEGQAHALVLAVDGVRDVESVTRAVAGRLPGAAAGRLAVLGWPELLPELLEAIELDDVFGVIFLGVFLVVIVFGVLSTVFTSVLERTPEFGVMLALGTKPRQVVWLVLAETVVLILVGAAVGVPAGTALGTWFEHHPIELGSAMDQTFAAYGIEPRLYFEVRPVKVAIWTGGLLALSLVFALWPAWRAASLAPDQAMRSVNG